MKVLHIVPYYPPDRIGGVGEVVAHLHRGLIKNGHRSKVVTAGESHDDLTVQRIASSRLGFVLGLFRAARQAGDFDLIHLQGGECIPFVLGMRIRRIHTPVLATFHVAYAQMGKSFGAYSLQGKMFGGGFGGWIERNVTARLHRATDWLTHRMTDATSYISKSSAVDHLGHAAAEQAEIVYNALPDFVDDVPQAEPEPVELLFVGTCGARKRIMALPFVLRHVREKLPQARLRIIGTDFECCKEFWQLVEDLQLSDAIVCEGRLTSEQIRPYYRASRVLLVPSVYEGLPMVILEALQCGLPCVATQVSGHPEVIQDGVNGFLVRLDDTRQMAEKCLAILESPTLQTSLSEEAPRVVAERFGLSRQLSEYVSLYERVCQSIKCSHSEAGQ